MNMEESTRGHWPTKRREHHFWVIVITAMLLISPLANLMGQTSGHPTETLRANFMKAFAFENLLPIHIGLPDRSWP